MGFFGVGAAGSLSSLERMLDTPRRLWMATAACVAAFLGLLVFVYATNSGAVADQRALVGFGALQRPRLADVSDGIAHLADPVPFALIGRTADTTGLYCVDIDFDTSMQVAIEHLVALGHRRIVFIASDEGGVDQVIAGSFRFRRTDGSTG